MNGQKINKMLFLIIMGVVTGVVLIYKNGSSLNRLNFLKKYGEETYAEVIENKKVYENDLSDEYYRDPLEAKFVPILKFIDELGNEYIIRDTAAIYSEKQEIGKRRKIIYDPEDPSIYLIDSDEKEIPIIFGIIIGIIFFLLSAYLLIDYNKY